MLQDLEKDTHQVSMLQKIKIALYETDF